MKKNKLCYIIVSLFFANFIYSQSEIPFSQENLATQLENYFKLDREKIHLHLNKNNYLTTDEIWFKGYIIEAKTNAPFFATSNVYVSVLDELGNKLKTKLFYAENSVFDGHIQLDKSYKTGKYFLQVYTNFMNNFLEDESSVFDFTIVNTDENNYIDNRKINFNEIDVAFYPESGTFLQNIINCVGVKIADCNDNGVTMKNIEVLDSKENIVTTFSTDTFGYGRITINPENNERYKVKFTINDKNYEKELPLSVKEGIVISVNNFGSKNKTALNIKTNSNSLDLLKSNSNSILIQQNNSASTIPFSFKNNESNQSLVIPNNLLMNGINTISIINTEGKKLAERIIYNPSFEPKTSEISIAQVRNDSIQFKGKSSLLNGSISISVLPYETTSETNTKSILNTFLLDNYLESPSKNMSYYLTDFSKIKHYELDSYLITQTSKYKLEDYLVKTSEKKYDFDNGLTIKGTVNNDLAVTSENYKINLNSLFLGLNETTTLNSKKEFRYENMLAIDSSAIYFTLYDKKEKPTGLNVYCQILNNNRKFNKSFSPYIKSCSSKNIYKIDDFILPKIKGQIILDEVAVQKKKKEVLTNKMRFSNSYSDGYKIDERLASTFRDVLSFIRARGFNVSENGLEVIITRNFSNSFGGSNSPAVFLDDVPVYDFSTLRNMNLNSVDEIYVNRTGFGGGGNGSNGIIRIYTKTIMSTFSNNIKINSKPFYVVNGFEKNTPFKNPDYTNTLDIGFQKFGTIHWIPSINTDENGDFKFSIPNLQQKTIKIIIEGISSEGELLSEIKILSIN